MPSQAGNRFCSFVVALTFVFVCAFAARAIAQSTLGIFQGSGDVGSVLHPGSLAFDPATDQYTVTGSGENMWLGKDAFYFVWRKATGDMTISADISFLGTGLNPHRKAVLMFRQSLQPDSVYADIALHGVGLTSLQYRTELAANTQEVQAKISAPHTLQLERHGDQFFMLLGDGSGKLEPAGGPIRVPIQGEYYIGIGVCSHDANVSETAVFSNVSLRPSGPGPQAALHGSVDLIRTSTSQQ
jgi:TolB protein